MFYVIVNANSVVYNLIQIKNGIVKYVYVNEKIMVIAEKIIIGIRAQVFVRR